MRATSQPFAHPALGINRIRNKDGQRHPDKGERHHLIRTRHLAVKHHRQQEHQRGANVLEEAQRGEAQTRCRAGKAQQGDRCDHACGHQHQVQPPWVAAHVAGGAVGNTEQVDRGDRQQPQGFK